MVFAEPLLLPGQPLITSAGASRSHGGLGTYERGSHLLSSVVGQVPSHSSVLSVHSGSTARFVVPNPGSTILGRITRVTPRQANISILIVDGLPCSMGDRSSASYANHAAGEDPMGGDFTGVIRSQDVRATEKDKIRMGDCFRPGDIVRATVISLGDARSYFLSTASNHLGVVYALPSPSPSALDGGSRGSERPLLPINWQEMQCPKTGIVEKRKVAKPE
ncbi:hypothetical protein CBS101457_000568 [Exobasidium rhododendri]|nr:hypothetical protein CBS101457_000568 [Exobasidium rhododendri]